jgi:MYXO-CTERM domain-containing protein
MIGLTRLIVILTGLLSHPHGLTSKKDQLGLLSPGAGGAVLVGWTALLALAGLVLTQRRDVT